MACDSKAKLIEDIECEGFDYALIHYDDYSAIPDPEFQKLYAAFLKSRQNLIDHLGIRV